MTARATDKACHVVPESTLALRADPYQFISKTCRRCQSDLFQTRVLLRKTICMTGEAAAELFYDAERFQRRGAAPARLQKTLFGRGGVQGLDNQEHLHRKNMFMSIVTPERVQDLIRISDHWWRSYARRWTSMDQVVLYQELQEILSRAVCEWAGVPLPEHEVTRRTRELTALFQYAGSVGPKHWWARLARHASERWIADVLKQVRADQLRPPPESAASIVAGHQDLSGQLLDPRVAAVELLNVLRPVVAVSVYVTLAAVALHEHPECRAKLQHDETGYREMFAQEVRRYYPFFPLLVARVRKEFSWQGFHFPRGMQVILDLHGTNHDERIWKDPHSFRPERFAHGDARPFGFIPQGGGDPETGHRCPGERIAIELIKEAGVSLSREITYEVPPQDLTIDLSHLPALPKSGFIMRDVQVSSTSAQ